MNEPGRWTAADVDGMVRPYVLSGNGPWLPPRSDQYNDDPFAPNPLASIGQPGWPEYRGQPEPAGPELDGPLAACDDHALADWSLALRRRPLRPVVAGIAAGVIAMACAFLAFLPAARTGRCSGRPCHAIAAGLPGAVPAAGRGPASAASASARPYAPSPRTSTPASAPPELTPERSAATRPGLAAPRSWSTAALAGITVSYRMTKFRNGGFEGEFTIMNGGTAPVHGWQLIVTLPGDHVLAAWAAGFQSTGETVVLTPPSRQAVIEPGTILAVHFIADGARTVPRTCTFNGAPCI
jgi:hypothetical protein